MSNASHPSDASEQHDDANQQYDKREAALLSTDDGTAAAMPAHEAALAEEWQAVLNVAAVDRDDDFFALGGHSLTAMQLIVRLARRRGLALSLRDVFEHRTLAGMAARIVHAGTAMPEPVRDAGDSRPLPLSSAQRGLWFLEHLHASSPYYNVPAAMALSGPLDVEALRTACGDMLAQHDALRTRFFEGAAGPLQETPADAPLDFVAADAGDADDALARMQADAAQPFSLGQAPLLRVRVYRCDSERHYLLLVFHHIEIDGWSFGLFCEALSACYAARRDGAPLPAHAPPPGYRDYTLWELAHRNASSRAVHVDYWKNQLAGVPPLVLATDRARGEQAGAGRRGGVALLRFDLAATLRLERYARERRATPFVVLLAAFQILLHRHTGQADFAIGSPAANRGAPGFEQTIGLFMNTLCLRADLTGDPTVAQCIARAARTVLDGMMHQHLPFDDVVKAVGAPREAGRNPLFQAMLVLQPSLAERLALSDVKSSDAFVHTGTSRFDLLLTLSQSVHGIDGVLEYDSDLFDATTAQRMAAHFETVVAAMLADADAPLSRLDALPAVQRRALLDAACGEARDYDLTATLAHWMAAQAARTPDADAVVFEGHRLSYAALDRAANALARRLSALGVGPGVFAGVFMERSIELVIALVAVLKAGGAYVPLDPGYPAARLALVAEDAAFPVLLTQAALAARGPAFDGKMLIVDDDATLEGDDAPFVCPAGPGDAAYMIYTSGSTGRPKGVVVPHRGICNRLFWMQEYFGLAPHDRVLQKTPYGFDVSVWEFFWPLMTGATLVMARPEGHRDSRYLRDVMAAERITTVHFVPSMLQAFLQESGIENLPALTRVICSGEALPAPLAQRFQQRLASAGLHNLYGPTEASVDVSYWTCPPAWAGTVVPIGRPVANTQLYVTDAHGALVPPGVPGELRIGGVQVALGYHRREALTAERFVADPFDADGTATLYRTGDLVRLAPDGNLLFLGRLDHQVKIRGQRIELGEIETLLAQHPAVQEAAVLAVDGGAGDHQLAGYYVPVAGNAPTDDELKAFLFAALPAYMVPARLLRLDTMPLSPNGKLDRKALPAPPVAGAPSMRGGVAPRTPAEVAMALVWGQVLGVRDASIDDSFFDLGGDSIRVLAVRNLAEAHGMPFALDLMFRHPTIRALAGALADPAEQGERTPAPAPFQCVDAAVLQHLPAGLDDAFPATQLQLGMLFHAEMEQGLPVYHDVFRYLVAGAWDAGRCRDALRALVHRHPSLRSFFAPDRDGGYLQLVSSACDLPLSVEDLRGRDAAAVAQAAAAWTDAEKRRPFDLAQAPLLRVHVQVLDDATFALGLSFHHAILDGWSVASLVTELLEALDGMPAPAAPPASGLGSFALLERKAVESPADGAYWRQQLEGYASPPVTYATPHGRMDEVGVVDVPLAAATLERLQQVSREAAVPLKTVLLAAHLVLVKSLTGGADVLTGLVANGRPELPDSERLLGLFLNVLPFRRSVSGGAWRDLIRDVFAQERETVRHRRYPLAQIQRDLQRDLQRGTLVEIVFNFVHFHVLERLSSVRPIGFDGFEMTQFPLAVNAYFDLAGAERGLRLRFVYQTQSFAHAAVERLVARYAQLLATLGAAPDAGIDEADLLLPADRADLDAWNATATPRANAPAVHERIAAIAASSGPAVAIDDGTHTLTYAELDDAAERLARRLRRHGARPGTFVALLLDRSPASLVAMVAALKAGAAYVPVDPAQPDVRIRSLVEDAAPVCVITDATLAVRLPADVPRVQVDDVPIDDAGPALPAVSLSDAAYAVFTSGSTGRPKGVVVEHGNLNHLVDWVIDAFGLVPGDRVSHIAGQGFDASVFEIWPALAAGASLHLPPEEARLSAELLQRWLIAERITVAFAPTLLGEALMDLPWPPDTALRVLNVGGEAMRRHPSRALPFTGHNLYGPSEATVATTMYRLPAQPGMPGVPPIGRPIANTQVLLVDDALRRVPPGSPGELCIAGPGVARGYLGRDDLTRERFVANPFGDGRLYRTGDVARWRHDGMLEFLGRADGQVKLRGYRIETGEIEAALLDCDAIAHALVTVFERDGEKCLAAYVVPRDGATVDAAVLRAHLDTRLPAYMVPAVFVPLASLPLTANGKRDVGALPDPVRFLTSASRVAPTTAMEQRLAAHWSAVLRVPAVGRDDDFFALGGHSLAAMQLMLRLRADGGLVLALRDVFEHRTLAAMASRLVERPTPASLAVDAVQDIPRADRTAPLPLSPPQTSLWFLDQLEGAGATTYLVPAAFRLRGSLDVAALRAALDEIVRRHEVLRTIFPAVEGIGVQRVLDVAPMAFAAIDLAALPAAAREVAVEEAVETNAATGFDLAIEPPVRASLLRLGAEDHVLLLALHHIATDGWSMSVLLRELHALYGAYAVGLPSPLAELPVQYADYAAWAAARLANGAIDTQLDFWRRRLADLPVRLDLPFDRPRPALQTWRGGTVEFVLSADVTAGLQRVCRERGATLFMGALAAFGVLLGRSAGETDFAIGTPSANRAHRDVEGLVGFFANVLVMRMDLQGDPDFATVLDRVRRGALDAYDHADVPFERLVEALALEPTPAHNPLFQAMFILQNPADGELDLPGVDISSLKSVTHSAKFDLTLSLEERAGGLAGAFEYNADLFDSATIERLAERFALLLAGLVADPAVPVQRVDWLPAAERRQVLEDFNRTAVDYPADLRIDALFAAQARQTPEAIALVFGDTALTYAELDERADALAARLVALGVAREDRVGLCLERSVEMIVGLLGILKAGAAYLPILPTTPAERFAWLLRDAGVTVLLTQTRRLASLPPFDGAVLCLDAPDTWLGVPAQPVRHGGGARDLAYVMHTSGSTGEPKGVMVEHRAVVRLVKNANYADFGGTQTFLSLAPLAFDAATFEIWGALLNGHTLVVAPPHEHSVDELAQLVATHGVTTLWLTAGLFHLMVDHQLDGLAPLRQLLAGGDVLSAQHVRRLKAAHPQIRLVNGYGPTENTTFTCTYDVPDGFDGATVPIGRPIANTRVYVLDGHLQPVPVGVRGQLYAAGDGLARGYWNQPALTSGAFVADPFDGAPDARMYRTGDEARWLPDGTIAFLGRRDAQVKLRGFRIELAEIEAALRRHPAVREAVAIVREDTPGDKRLVAYVVAGDMPMPSAGDLKAFLRTRLPDYMLPWTCMELPLLPLTTNGKVDRRALPAPSPAQRAPRVPLAPRNREEAALVRAWEDALHVRSVGVDDNFFELGGHSLTAVKAAALASQALGVAIPVRWVFRFPTPEQLAQALRTEQGFDGTATVVPLRSRGRGTPVFCFHALFATALFYADLARELGDDRPVYGLQAPGLYGEEAPQRDIGGLVERHVAAIRRVQPQGPYCLVGYCMGGVLAVEAARRLRADGADVQLLALLDSFHAPQGVALPPDEPQALFEAFVSDLVARAGGDDATALAELRAQAEDARLDTAMAWARKAAVLPSDITDAAGFLPWMRTSAANGTLYLKHVAQAYDGDVLFLRAADREHDALASWAEIFSGKVELADMPGDHASMIEAPDVSVVAAALRSALAAAEVRRE